MTGDAGPQRTSNQPPNVSRQAMGRTRRKSLASRLSVRPRSCTPHTILSEEVVSEEGGCPSATQTQSIQQRHVRVGEPHSRPPEVEGKKETGRGREPKRKSYRFGRRSGKCRSEGGKARSCTPQPLPPSHAAGESGEALSERVARCSIASEEVSSATVEEESTIELTTTATTEKSPSLPAPVTQEDAVLSYYWKKPENEPAPLIKIRPASDHLVDLALGFVDSQPNAALKRQARDLLVCHYQGDIRKFQEDFLWKAAALLRMLKDRERQPVASRGILPPNGWPLVLPLPDRPVAVHLGELDPSSLRPGDFYLCVPARAGPAQLVLRYCIGPNGQVGEQVISPSTWGRVFTMDWLGSLRLDAASDDQLTGLLRHMLVAVEKGVERIQWEAATRTDQCPHLGTRRDSGSQTANDDEDKEEKTQDERAPLASPTSDDPDDGYCEEGDGEGSGPVHPSSLDQVNQHLLHSKMLLLPGCRDAQGRAVVNVDGRQLASDGPKVVDSAVQLLLYFLTVPKKEVATLGLLALLDATDAPRESLSLLDEILASVEASSPGAVSGVVVWRPSGSDWPAGHQVLPQSALQYEVVCHADALHRLVLPDQLLPSLGGSYHFDLDEWRHFRQRFEPFVQACRSSGRRLVSAMQGLRGSRLPPTTALTAKLVEEHRQQVGGALDHPELERLKEEGEMVLEDLEESQRKDGNNSDLREAVERTKTLSGELTRATVKLSRLSAKRLAKLEEALQLRTFEEEAGQVLSWLCKKGEEALTRYQGGTDNMAAARAQERDFEKFYFVAMRNIEKGHDLLEEAAVLSRGTADETGAASVVTLSQSLQTHLRGFSERLEDTRERLEDTATCYQQLDKAYEWALEAMKFVSRMKMEQNSSVQQLTQLMKALQAYLASHPPIPEETFNEMVALATKVGNDRLLEQCKVAQARCQETTDLIKKRQATLMKARQQMECEGEVQIHPDSSGEFTMSSLEGEMTLLPQLTSTPVPSWANPPPTSNSHPYTRRRSLAVLPSTGHAPSGGYVSQGYSSFFRESYRLDGYISENDETLSEDLMPAMSSEDRANELSSGPYSLVEEPSSGPVVNRPPPKFPGSVGPQFRPPKKYMRRSQTWQFDMDPWEKVMPADTVFSLQKDFGKGSLESIHTVVENDELSSLESRHKVCPPVAVNSHLHQRGSSLSLQFPASSMSDLTVTETQVKQNRTLTLIIREMVQTERDYVKSLEYIIENYIPELLREDIPQALRGKRNVVFGNIEKIYEFHNQYFLHELERCERSPFHVGQCFLHYERQFYLYALYNKNKPKSDELMLEYGRKFFKSKQVQLGDKMDLASYLLKPVQRMGKYALLLKQLLKECPDKEPEYTDLKAAEDMVKFQLRHGNDLLAMDCIRDCDVDLKEQGRLLRQDEFLVWQGKSRKCLRHVFLFEELIVFSKARRDPEKKGRDIYQYKNSIKMADIGMTEQVGESNAKFEIWFRKCKLQDTYTLQAPTAEIRAPWIQEISKLLWKQALRNRELRLAEMTSMGIGNKPCLDIKPSQDQINDRSISISQLTKAPRFRSSITVHNTEQMRNNKRPHSIISVSSSSSGSSQSSSISSYGALNLGFDPNDSPRAHSRSITQESQCSTESGIVPDISSGYESLTDLETTKRELEQKLSSASSDTMSTTSSLPLSPVSENAPSAVKEASTEGSSRLA